MDELGLFASILGHVGDGNFHESVLYDNTDPKERAAVERCLHDMVDRALEMDGTCTVGLGSAVPYRPKELTSTQGEHGVGLGKKEFLVKELGPDTIDVMRGIKRSLDPYWLMNPGKIFEATRSATPKDSRQATAATSLERPQSERNSANHHSSNG